MNLQMIAPSKSGVPEQYRKVVEQMAESTCNVSSDVDAARMYPHFEKRGGKVDRAGLREVFPYFFENPSLEQPQMLLGCPLLLDRWFSFMDSENKGFIDFGQMLNGIAMLFSGFKEEQVKIHLAFYDPKNTGFVVKEEVISFTKTFLASMLDARAKHFHTSDEQLKFATIRSQAEGAVGSGVLRALLDRGFQVAGEATPKLTVAKFTSGYRANPTHFHFQHLAHDIIEVVSEEQAKEQPTKSK